MGVTGLHYSYGSWAFVHLPFTLRSLDLFFASLSFMKGRERAWCCLLAFYIVTPGPAETRTVCKYGMQITRFLSRMSYLPSYVFLRRRRSFTSRKLYAYLEKFLCFSCNKLIQKNSQVCLTLSDRAYVSGARCI